MGGNYLSNAGVFLVQTLFGFIILAVMLRLLLQLVRADFYNPVSQFLVKITNPLVVPLRRITPGFRGIDLASVILLILLQLGELVLVALLNGVMPRPAGLAVLAVASLLSLLINVYFFSILIQVILSWVSPGTYNPVAYLLYQLNEPILGRARRVIPPISGFDLSPVVAAVGLQLLSILLVAPLTDFARSLM